MGYSVDYSNGRADGSIKGLQAARNLEKYDDYVEGSNAYKSGYKEGYKDSYFYGLKEKTNNQKLNVNKDNSFSSEGKCV